MVPTLVSGAAFFSYSELGIQERKEKKPASGAADSMSLANWVKAVDSGELPGISLHRNAGSAGADARGEHSTSIHYPQCPFTGGPLSQKDCPWLGWI